MIKKFAGPDNLKIWQVEVISECGGLLNVSNACALPFMLVIFV